METTVNFNKITKQELGIFLNPLIDLAFQMLNANVLKKNVIKHFTNKGISFEASENMVEVATFRYNEFNKNKCK